jgi:hypothetical protein
MSHFAVELQGLPALRARLQPGRLLQPTKAFIKDLAETAQRTAQRAAKPHSADKGTLGRQIAIEYSSDGELARIYPQPRIANVAQTVEVGRKAGKRPPYGPIKRWAIAHGFIPSGKGNSKLVHQLRERVMHEGTKGVHFMQTAEDVTERAMREGIPHTEQEIHAAWERPA